VDCRHGKRRALGGPNLANRLVVARHRNAAKRRPCVRFALHFASTKKRPNRSSIALAKQLVAWSAALARRAMCPVDEVAFQDFINIAHGDNTQLW
jgi:hypothetical protein